MPLSIPESVEREHSEILSRMLLAAKATGKTGEAARDLASELHPHFKKEEESALPLLGMLKEMAEEGVEPESLHGAIELYRKFTAEYSTMLDDHRRIKGLLKRLRTCAEKERLGEILGFTDTLEIHAKLEEEILYPAALIVGRFAEIRMSRHD